jgi:hypothetical protein
VFGTLIYGTIQSIITFQGTLSSWWTRIVIGLLIFVFILLQSLFNSRERKLHGSTPTTGGRKTIRAALAGSHLFGLFGTWPGRKSPDGK